MTSPAVIRRGTDAAPRWDHPVAPARLPQQRAVEEALAKIRAWNPYDGDAWLDDVADALDDVPPAEDKVDDLALCLRGHLMQLVSIAISREADKRDERVTPLIARAREARESELPGDYPKAINHLRRMGWAVNELLDVLVEIGTLKQPDSLAQPATRKAAS
ncbi:DUF6415 family natural product biosynthesis protein [Streptomyces sp. NPDC016172]|uniref:DUF6415 family natural product biosynthesis protein n=1 Tax=Streptomyces sp. NPDC016172 TaxID=3364964 RepID=UPI0036FD28BC